MRLYTWARRPLVNLSSPPFVYHRSTQPRKGCCTADGHVDNRYALRWRNTLERAKPNNVAFKVLEVDARLAYQAWVQAGPVLQWNHSPNVAPCWDRCPASSTSSSDTDIILNYPADNSLDVDLKTLQIKQNIVIDTSVHFWNFFSKCSSECYFSCRKTTQRNLFSLSLSLSLFSVSSLHRLVLVWSDISFGKKDFCKADIGEPFVKMLYHTL